MKRYDPYYARFLNKGTQKRKKQRIARILAVTTAVCITVSNPGVLQPLSAYATEGGLTASVDVGLVDANLGDPSDFSDPIDFGDPIDSDDFDGYGDFGDLSDPAEEAADPDADVLDASSDEDEVQATSNDVEEQEGGALSEEDGAFYANAGDTIYYSDEDGKVYKVEITEDGLFLLPDGAVLADEDDYAAYIESLRIAAGGFSAEVGDVIYYELGGAVYKVVVDKAGVYSLPKGATVSNEASYNAYIKSLAVADGGIFAKAGDVLFYADASGKVFKVIVNEDGLFKFPGGTTESDEAAYEVYVASLAVSVGGINLEAGMHYFAKDGKVFAFAVAEAGWYDLDGATEVDEAAYLAYLEELRADDPNSINLDLGTHYFAKDGEVFKFEVTKAGWYILDGAVETDEAEYTAYIASLAVTDGGIKLGAGTHYFEKDGKVFAFEVTKAGWYALGEATPTDEAAYTAYLELFRAADESSINLAAGTYYFVNADDEVFMFVVTEDNEGWFDLGGVAPTGKGEYDKYIAKLATADGGINLEAGMHYFAKDGEVFVFEVTEAGWYNLDGATEKDVAVYQAYLESLRGTDANATHLAAGTHYFLKDGKVFMFTVAEAGWFKLDGATPSSEPKYNEYIAGLAMKDGGIYLDASMHYFEAADGKVFVFEVTEAGWYGLAGAVEKDAEAYQEYLEGMRAADTNSTKLAAGTYYFKKGEEVFLFAVDADGWFKLDGAIPSDEAAYNAYIKSLAIGVGGVELAAGTHYFAKDGKVFVFEVAEAGWYNLAGAAETDADAYQAYLEDLREKDENATALAAGTYYFKGADGKVFMFEVTEPGWFKLDGATETDAEAYQEYIDGLATGNGGIELAAGTYYFKTADGEVFIFEVAKAGWYDLNGATETDTAAYMAYLEGLRAADSSSINLTAGTYFFKGADGKVFMFVVTEENAGWFDLDGAEQVGINAYDDYIAGLAKAGGGIELSVGTYYFEKGDAVFMFVVTEENAGWYDLDGATETDAAAYQIYLESLRVADSSSINLTAGTHYFEKGGEVFMFIVDADGWFNLDGAAKTDAAAYQTYVEGLAVSNGGIELSVGTYYFKKGDAVFMFEVAEAGWYNLGGAVKTDAAAYQTYIDSLAVSNGGINIEEAGTYYFAKDGKVFVFEVTEAGWYDLDGAVKTDAAAYQAYLESLRAADTSSIELPAGTYYFAKDGKVFVFEVTEAGWYNLNGAVKTDAAAYQTYLESLRAADTSSIELKADTYYFAKDGKVFMFVVAADGWFNLDGATKVTEEAYNAYIADLAKANGGIELGVGMHYFEKDEKVFVFEVTTAGWYNLNGAKQAGINAYMAYIEGLRKADTSAIELTADTYYFAKDGKVFMFEVAADGWFNLDGAVKTDAAVYQTYVEGLAVGNGGIELAAGMHYFKTVDGKVFVFEVTTAGWYNLDGAEKTDAAEYMAYLEDLREADDDSIELAAGTHYFEKDGKVFMFVVAKAGWYDLDGAEQVGIDEYNTYITGLVLAYGGIDLAAGTHYFAKDGKVFVFEVTEAGLYDLDGATPSTETAYNDYIEGLAATDGAFYVEENGVYYYQLGDVIYKATATADGWYKIPKDAEESTEAAYEAALGEYLEELDKYWDELKASLGLMDFNQYESPEAAYSAAMEAVEKMNAESKAAYEEVCDGWWAGILEQFPSVGLENSWKDYESISEAAAAAQIAADEANAAAYGEYVSKLHEMWDELYKQYGAYLDYDNLEEFLAAYDGDLSQIQIIINQAFEDKKADIIAQRPPMHKQLTGLAGAQGNVQNSDPGNNRVPAPTNPLTSSGSTINLGAGVTLRYQSNNAFLDINSSADGFELGVYDFYYRSGGNWYHMVIDIVEIINNGSFQISLQGYANSGMQAIYGDRATYEEEMGQLPSPPTPVGLADPTDAPEDIPIPNPLPEGGFGDGNLQSYNLADNAGLLNGYDIEDNDGDLPEYVLAENPDELEDYGDLDSNMGSLLGYILATNPDVLEGYGDLDSNMGSLLGYILATNPDVLEGYGDLDSNMGSLLGYILATNPDVLDGYGDLDSNMGSLLGYILATNPSALGDYELDSNLDDLLAYILESNYDELQDYTLGSSTGDLPSYVLATNPDALEGYTLGSNLNSLLEYILATNPDALEGYTLGSSTGDLLDYILATNPDVLDGYDLKGNSGSLLSYILATNPDMLDEYNLKDNLGSLLEYILATNPDLLEGFELGESLGDLDEHTLQELLGKLDEFNESNLGNVKGSQGGGKIKGDPEQQEELEASDKVVIDDPEVPAAGTPENSTATDDDPSVTSGEEVVLSDIPKTGTEDEAGMFGLFGLSLFGLAAAFRARRKVTE